MNSKNASEWSREGSYGKKALVMGLIKDSARGWSATLSQPSVFTVVALILVASSSFALGRLSVLEQNREPMRIEYQDQATSISDASDTTINSSPGGVVASKTGSVYYFPWCTGALKIAEANKMTFASELLAKNAGLRPAGNCKGMGK